MTNTLDPGEISRAYLEDVRAEVHELGARLSIVGLLATEDKAAQVYADYTRRGCERIDIGFSLSKVPRLELENEIQRINEDPGTHGVLVYYPIFGVERDNFLKDLVDPRKDIEGLSTYWLRRLYTNDRTDPDGHKAILPCTPLAIIKLLDAAVAKTDARLAGQTVVVFNRSEVVGRPLASMLANDGAHVVYFDEYGPLEISPEGRTETKITRAEALKRASIVVTGVSSRQFRPIDASELGDAPICLNFSTIRNFTDEARAAARIFIPRVGPMTVTMVLRNAARLYRNYHAS